jgi:ribonuclease HI
MDDLTATIHIDGGARGNPGPAAYAVVLARPGRPAVEEAGTIGTATNNVAEYTALVNALHLATELGLKRLDVFSDSELLVKQMAGEYRVKHPDLQPLYQEATELRKGFEAVRITHVRRELNKRADALCNEALDGKRSAGQGPAPAAGAAAPAKAAPAAPKKAVTDDRVREDALVVLASAARAWADRGPAAVPVEAVWEQLWSVLEEAGVLKKK